MPGEEACAARARFIIWPPLLLACALFHYSLLGVIPRLTDLRRSLQSGFDDVLGFGRLETDAFEVAAAASYALRLCRVHSRAECFGQLSVSKIAHDMTGPHQRIQSSFLRTLGAVQEVASDDYFGTPTLLPISSYLHAIADNVALLNSTSVPCKGILSRYCAILVNAEETVQQAPAARREVNGIVDHIMETIYEELLLQPHLVFLHALSPLAAAAMLLFHWYTAQHHRYGSFSRRKYYCERCNTGLHIFCCTLVVLGSLALAFVGLEVTADVGIVSFAALNNRRYRPSLSKLLSHVHANFPGLWKEVFDDEDQRFVFLWWSSLAMLAICISIVLYRMLAYSCGSCCRRPPSSSELQEECLDMWPSASEDEMQELHALKPCQLLALENVRQRCQRLHVLALPELRRRARRMNFTDAELDKALSWMREHAPIIIHIKLDHVGAFLASDSHYRNQFETSTSGGTLDHAKRTHWENQLFDGAYDTADAFDRCKYGAMNITNDPQGVRACLQYGVSYLLIRGARLRTTFCSTDSAGMHSDHLATVDCCAHVFNKFTDGELKCALEVGTQRKPGMDSQVLRSYKEAQIHGEIRLEDHVELIMAHPSLQSSPHSLESLRALANRCRCPVVWIEGGIDVPASIPVRSSSGGTRSSGDGGMTSVSVRLPMVSFVPGQMIQVEVPGGQLLKITVPPGAVPGKQITIQYPRSSIPTTAAASGSEIWEVEGGDGWSAITEPALSAIRRALSEGSRIVRYENCGFDYELNLDVGVQKNLATGRQRMVRHRPAA